VAGWLLGERIRKNFKTRENAAAGRAALEVRLLQSQSNLRAASTSLTEAQLREAEAAFLRLEKARRPLTFYLDYRRVHAGLRAAGNRVTQRRVARLMREECPRGRQKHPCKPRTTPSNHEGPIAPNRLRHAAMPSAMQTHKRGGASRRSEWDGFFSIKHTWLPRKPLFSSRAVGHAPCNLCLGAGIQHQDELMAVMDMFLPIMRGMHGITNINEFIVDANKTIPSRVRWIMACGIFGVIG
jgi:hypothetical protein